MEESKLKYRKWSKFIKWVFSICVVTAVIIGVYIILDAESVIAKWSKAVNGGNRVVECITLVMVFIAVLAYVMLALYIFLSHRSVEDPRMHALPILFSPLFLIAENGLLHLWNYGTDPYYEILMSVFSATVVGVITFASIKLSFEISSQRSRFIETAANKPNITITKDVDHSFNVTVSEKKCYLAGLFVGRIEKKEYRDNKHTGNIFSMSRLVLPNKKDLLDIGADNRGTHKLDITKIANVDLKELCNDALSEQHDIYIICRDMQNYYYFSRLPLTGENETIGVNEHMITRLAHKNNKFQYKQRTMTKFGRFMKKMSVGTKKILYKMVGKTYVEYITVYESMDWFSIPYNFFAE